MTTLFTMVVYTWHDWCRRRCLFKVILDLLFGKSYFATELLCLCFKGWRVVTI